MLEGISPESWFLEKSRDSSNSMSPTFFGIIPVRQFPERFSDRSPTKLASSFGISPDKLLLERSMLVTKGSVASYWNSLPFVTTYASSKSSPLKCEYEITPSLLIFVAMALTREEEQQSRASRLKQRTAADDRPTREEEQQSRASRPSRLKQQQQSRLNW
ncbi:hypothetical protein RJ639_030389 [Escallonia herrerae]|uniref:Uncharacterized protein n=1 Tax=Escallonia herrerae TaxID=1293975 RepID=A0AA88X141_9ASTE|nr:hypothetical protein RJ639_030389 [Escallonia herrerae]